MENVLALPGPSGGGSGPGSRLPWGGEGLLLARPGHLVRVLLQHTHRANPARIQSLWGPQKVLLKSINPSHERERGDEEESRCGWKECDKQLYFVYTSRGLGIGSFVRLKQIENCNSLRG